MGCCCVWRYFWCSVQGRPGGDLLSRGLSRSTIGAGGFHFRVRDGIGWIFPRHSHQAVLEQNGGFLKRAVVALILEGFVLPGVAIFRLLCVLASDLRRLMFSAGSASSYLCFTIRLCRWSLPLYAVKVLKPIERLVLLSFARYRASTCSLSTWWSSTVLSETWF